MYMYVCALCVVHLQRISKGEFISPCQCHDTMNILFCFCFLITNNITALQAHFFNKSPFSDLHF